MVPIIVPTVNLQRFRPVPPEHPTSSATSAGAAWEIHGVMRTMGFGIVNTRICKCMGISHS